jgi:hypothetical protein
VTDAVGRGSPEADAADRGTSEAEAARRVLAGDGRDFVLQPWQVAYLFALVEGRNPVVPPGCGVGKGWLETRLREALEAGPDGPLW